MLRMTEWALRRASPGDEVAASVVDSVETSTIAQLLADLGPAYNLIGVASTPKLSTSVLQLVDARERQQLVAGPMEPSLRGRVNAVELKDFIKEGLLAIVRGIREAQAAEDVGAFIVPGQPGLGALIEVPPNNGVFRTGNNTFTTVAEFDVAVTAESGQTSGGKGGLKIWVVNAGISGENSNKAGSVSRIEFSISIVLPRSQRSWTEDEKK